MTTRRKLYVSYFITETQKNWVYETTALIHRLHASNLLDTVAVVQQDLEHRHIDASHFLQEEDMGFLVDIQGDRLMVTDNNGWCQPESIAVFLQGFLNSTGDERVLHGTYSEEKTESGFIEFSGGFFVVDQHDYRVENTTVRMVQVRTEFDKS